MTPGSSHFRKSNGGGAQEEDHLVVSEGCGTGKDRGERRGRWRERGYEENRCSQARELPSGYFSLYPK